MLSNAIKSKLAEHIKCQNICQLNTRFQGHWVRTNVCKYARSK